MYDVLIVLWMRVVIMVWRVMCINDGNIIIDINIMAY